ncbi:MAG: hypothetical protein DRR15_19360, partial [Gammaproteobacteria bacterium]
MSSERNRFLFRPAVIASVLLACVIAGCGNGNTQETYDVVIVNGRVMDPETNFDGVRNVGIKNG